MGETFCAQGVGGEHASHSRSPPPFNISLIVSVSSSDFEMHEVAAPRCCRCSCRSGSTELGRRYALGSCRHSGLDLLAQLACAQPGGLLT
jgi:hypothetical protein